MDQYLEEIEDGFCEAIEAQSALRLVLIDLASAIPTAAERCNVLHDLVDRIEAGAMKIDYAKKAIEVEFA